MTLFIGLTGEDKTKGTIPYRMNGRYLVVPSNNLALSTVCLNYQHKKTAP